MFPQTTLLNSDSTGALLSGPASPVFQTGHFFVQPICLLVAYLPIAAGARQHKHDLEEVRSILENTSSAPHYPFHPRKEHTNRKKKGSSHVQEPTQPAAVQWSGTLTPDPDLLLTTGPERKCSDGFKSVRTSSKPWPFSEFKRHLSYVVNISNNQLVTAGL